MQKSTDADTGTRRSVPCYGLKGWNVVLLLYSSVDKKKCNAMRELELLDVCRWARDDHAVMLWRDVLLSSGFVYTVPSLRIRINVLMGSRTPPRLPACRASLQYRTYGSWASPRGASAGQCGARPLSQTFETRTTCRRGRSTRCQLKQRSSAAPLGLPGRRQ